MSLKTVLKPMQHQSGVIKLTPFVTNVVSASLKKYQTDKTKHKKNCHFTKYILYY